MEGYVKINRKLLEWNYFSDGNVLRVFLFLLLRANHKDNTVFDTKVLRGQHITSIRKISVYTDLSVKQVRLALNKLKKDQTIITKGTNKNTLVTFVKYDAYQGEKIKEVRPEFEIEFDFFFDNLEKIFGLKCGLDTEQIISPVCISITTIEPVSDGTTLFFLSKYIKSDTIFLLIEFLILFLK